MAPAADELACRTQLRPSNVALPPMSMAAAAFLFKASTQGGGPLSTKRAAFERADTGTFRICSTCSIEVFTEAEVETSTDVIVASATELTVTETAMSAGRAALT